MDIRALFSTPVKQWVKERPVLANLVDTVLTRRRRDLPVFTDIPTLLTAAERECLYRLARATEPPGVVVEIGCWAGGSSYFLGKGAARAGTRVFSVDPFESDPGRLAAEDDGTVHYRLNRKPTRAEVAANLRRHGLADVVTLVEGFSLDTAARWSRPVGLLFIDGNHLEAPRDVEAWDRHVRPGGVVAFHDSNYPRHKHASPEVSAAVERLIETRVLEVVTRVDRITAVRWAPAPESDAVAD